MGSKNRHAKELLSIILKDRLPNQYFVDLFCGGCNIVDKVNGPRIANDINYYLIEMFKAVSTNQFIPPDYVTNEYYNEIRKNPKNYPPYLVGFVAFGCSYSGKEWGGYARGNDSKGNPRNYCLESKKNLLKQVSNLKGIQFYNKNYWEIEIPENAICYCDIPYKNSTKYKDNFDHDKFWDWARNQSKLNKVYISEYSAPSDF